MPEEVISDTSSIQYLYQSDCLDLLPRLYQVVTLPQGVVSELSVGRQQGVSLPEVEALAWVRVKEAPHLGVLPLAADLGQGEKEVLALAAGRPGVLAILDDGLARQFARHLQVQYTGTLGVLLKAKDLGLLDEVRPILDHLQSLGFWLDATTRAAVLKIAGES